MGYTFDVFPLSREERRRRETQKRENGERERERETSGVLLE
jgi:hypothetical protein